MRYKNPTLTELVAELHLEPGTLPQKTMMAFGRELAARGFEDQEFVQAIGIVESAGNEAPEPRIGPRIRCWDRERTMLVQFSPDLVLVNLIGEYPGWSVFKEHAGMALEALEGTLKFKAKIVRVDLTAVDKWRVVPPSFTIGRYLNCDGVLIPRWYSAVAVSSDVILGQGFHLKDGFNKKINVAVRVSADTIEFQIITVLGVTRSGEEVDVLLDSLHRESVECFEALITDVVRTEVMGGIL